MAATGTIINIPDAYADERFNRSFDISSGYRTQTILCVPMRDATGEVTGVIQALNKRGGRIFDAEDEELLLALGAQAAGAIENALLHEEINRLFEGFVSASVVAIEARDPTTAGHSGRVADLTVGLAQALEHLDTGIYANDPLLRRGDSGAALRLAAPRLRQGGRARAGARQGREALPARAGHAARRASRSPARICSCRATAAAWPP